MPKGINVMRAALLVPIMKEKSEISFEDCSDGEPEDQSSDRPRNSHVMTINVPSVHTICPSKKDVVMIRASLNYRTFSRKYRVSKPKTEKHHRIVLFYHN
jgi:hypothetical protein